MNKTLKQRSSPSYRDTLFRTLFSDEERAIELCNAVAGTSFPPGTPVTMGMRLIRQDQ